MVLGLFFWVVSLVLKLELALGKHRLGHHTPLPPQKKTAHNDHFFTAAISKFIEIDWFLQIIVKLIFPQNMKLEKGFIDPKHQNRRLMVGCKNVYLISTINRKKRENKICTRALKICQKLKCRCKNRTDFFLDYFAHFVTNTGL